MLEDLNRAAAFIQEQESHRIRKRPDITTPEERKVAGLLSRFMGDFGMDCRIIPLGEELPMFDWHPLKHALLITPAVTVSGDGFKAVLRVGCVSNPDPEKPFRDVSHHVVVDEFIERYKQPLVLMIADEGDRVVNRYGRRLRTKQLEGGAAMLRLMMEGVDPNDKQRFWDRYMERVSQASSTDEKLKLMTVGVNA